MIEAKNLSKWYGPVKAVDGIGFSVGKGEVLGFLGPNGAGKSTAMKMIACFLPPDGGTATVCGHDIQTDSLGVRQALGYLGENAPAYGEMTVGAFLNFICDAREIHGARRKSALDRVVTICSIGSVFHQTIETLSKGYRRRVGLAQALVHDPQALILDEPTDGLDPNQKYDVRSLIKEMAKDKCIIISTHILEEAEAVCNRAIIVAKGKILVDSTPSELRQKHQMTLDDVFRKLTGHERRASAYAPSR